MFARRRQATYSAEAQTDIRDILLYTEQTWNDRQRDTYEQLLRNTVRTLAQSPGLGRTRDDLAPGLRSYPVGSHVLYYWELETTLVVARIMHSRGEPSREEWLKPPQPD